MWAGVASALTNGGKQIEIAISIHDSVYATDFTSFELPYDPKGTTSELIEERVLKTFRNFSKEHMCKFLGAGVTLSLLREV
jgi:alpha,alpha-trehalose phosphorylase (configuration-retaining)